MDVSELRFYLSLINPQLLPSIGGRPGELIRELQKKNLSNDDFEEINLMFEGKWKKQNNLNLKQRTLKILTGLLFVSPPKGSELFIKRKWKCRRLLVTAKILVDYFKREKANSLFVEVLKVSEEYGFSNMAYEASMELFGNASFKNDKKMADYYLAKCQLYGTIVNYENKAKLLYFTLARILNSNSKEKIISIEKDLKDLNEISCSSPRFIQYTVIANIAYNFMSNKLNRVIESIEVVLVQLNNQKGLSNRFVNQINKFKALCEISLGEHKEAEYSLREAELDVDKSENIFQNIQYIRAINKFHLGDCQGVFQMYLEYRKSKYKAISDQWLILGAYLYFLNRIGEIEIGAERFSIGKYLNETSGSNHDKRGGNVQILIGELLVYLVRNPDKFISRIENVSHYNYKYLNTPDTLRARSFIKILCAIPRAQFNSIKLQRKAKRYIEELNTHQINLGMNINIEIIPYEKLLEFVLKYLDDNRAKFL